MSKELAAQSLCAANSFDELSANGDIAGQDALNQLSVLHAIVDYLLFSGPVSIMLHAKVIDFICKPIQCRHVFVGDRETEVPIVGAR